MPPHWQSGWLGVHGWSRHEHQALVGELVDLARHVDRVIASRDDSHASPGACFGGPLHTVPTARAWPDDLVTDHPGGPADRTWTLSSAPDPG